MRTTITMNRRALLLGSCLVVYLSLQNAACTPTVAPVTPSPKAVPAAPQIEGLDLLNRIGIREGPLMSYQAVRPTAAQIHDVIKLSRRLAQGAGVKFGADSVRIDETHNALHANGDHSASFAYDTRTGNFVFNGGMNRYRKDKPTKGLPSEGAAAALARKQLLDLGLRPDASELKLAHVGGVNMGVTDGKGNTKIYEKLRTVRFSRVLAGLPVEGDTRIVVQLGEGRRVSSLVYQWPALTASTLDPRTALADAQTLKARALETIRAGSAKAERSKLTVADLVLYDDGAGVIEPAYHFVVEQYFPFPPGQLTMNPFDFYLPALKNSKANFPKVNEARVAPKEDRGEAAPKNTPLH